MVAGRRVGVFGGTFDPPHVGHSIVAAEVAEAVALDRVLWVPASIPPHKQGRRVSPAAVRRRMVEAAVSRDPRFELCNLELERGGVSYTVDTLRSLRASHPGWSLFLILGPDLPAGFASWKEPEAIGELAEPVAILRAGAVPPRTAELAGARVVRVTTVDVSSSRIRRRVAREKAVSDMVVPGVLSIIESERLYRASREAPGEHQGRPGSLKRRIPPATGGCRTGE